MPRGAAGGARGRPLRDQAGDHRPGRDARAGDGGPARPAGTCCSRACPGLAKTLTIKTLASVGRRQLQPHPVHARPGARRTSSARASTGPTAASFDTELGPVFANFLLADEINRAPAKVQSALLEVMQEQQVTIGGATLPGPAAVPRARDAEPDRVRGHLPAARGAGRPLPDEDPGRLPGAGRRGGRRRAARSIPPACVEERLTVDRPAALPRGASPT